MEKVTKILTPQQLAIVAGYVHSHDLSENQISFQGDSLKPIFDYPALNVLRLRLTDIKNLEPVVVERTDKLVTARCNITLADDRTASDLGTAEIGETLHDGSKIENLIQAQNVAISRSARRGLVAAGVDLDKAHNRFRQTGEIFSTEPIDLDLKFQREIHALRDEWGHSDSQYRLFLQDLFKVSSSTDLNELQRSHALNTYRVMINSRRETLAKAA